jgi:hypothetical protein
MVPKSSLSTPLPLVKSTKLLNGEGAINTSAFPDVLRVDTADVSKLTLLSNPLSATSIDIEYEALQLPEPTGLFKFAGHAVHTVAAEAENVPPGHRVHTVPFKNLPAAQLATTMHATSVRRKNSNSSVQRILIQNNMLISACCVFVTVDPFHRPWLCQT